PNPSDNPRRDVDAMNPTQQPDRCAVAVLDGGVTPAAVLRGASVYVRRHGLYQGDMFANPLQPFPAACAQGAIKMAACGNPIAAYTPGQAALVDDAITTLADHL